KHTRQVEWLITEAVSLPANFFPQNTIARIDRTRWDEIKQAYLTQNPDLQEAFQELGDVVESEAEAPVPDVSPDSEELQELNRIASHTRNIILYGPPGTGKTYLVRKFAERFLQEQILSTALAEEKRNRVLQGLKWYEALGLAMAFDKGKLGYKVGELANH